MDYITDVIAVGTLLELCSTVVAISIVVISLLSVYWHIQFLVITQWSYYSPLKLLTAFVSLLFALIFTHIAYRYFVFGYVDGSIFGMAFIRPIILLQAGVSAATGRARVVIAKRQGGEIWHSNKEKKWN